MRMSLLTSGFVVYALLLAGAQAGAPALEPGTSLEQCWWPEGSPQAASAACEQHRAAVMTRWRNHNSYYALLEIVETRLHFGLGKMRREAVIDLLGDKNIDRDYPNSRRDGFLVWGSDRSLPMGSYLVVQFDKNGVAHSYDWVSE